MSEIDLLPSDKQSNTFRVMNAAATGTLIASAVIAPNILRVFARKLDKDKESKTLRAIRHAKERGWLTLRDTPNGVEVALTKSGEIKWRQLQLEQPIYHKKWDGKWRMVLFDVPVEKKNNAQVFRNSLKRLGFRQFQKSIWIIPYPCQTEVAALRQIYELKNYVRIIEAVSVDNENSLKQKFNLEV